MWFTNGKIARDYIFENGKSVRMKNYYLNGSLQTDGRTEKNGDVYEKEYYENGKLKAEFKGNLNTLSMTRKEYDETGKVIKEEKVENGVRVL